MMDAKSFRERAAECRRLAAQAKDADVADSYRALAEVMEQRAEKIENDKPQGS